MLRHKKLKAAGGVLGNGGKGTGAIHAFWKSVASRQWGWVE